MNQGEPGRCRNCSDPALPNKTRCTSCTRVHSRSNNKNYQARRAVIREARNKPCIDCGTQLPPDCMDLDHRDESAKVVNVGAMGSCSLKAILAEIAKCDVRCPNCHRLRHYREKQKGLNPPTSRRAA